MIPPRSSAGLTLVEVLLALAVIGIVTAAFTTAVVGNLHHSSVTGARTEAVQVLDYLGRRVAGGDSAVMPPSGSSRSWAYGSLASSFPDLTDHGGLSDPGRYRASVTSAGDVALAGSSVAQYDVRVCFEAAGGEHCVSATTMGLYPSSGGSSPQLPGIY